METLQPVLLYGRYEWQRDLQPVEEFEARLAAVRDAMHVQRWDALIVHGDSRENAALCYMTNFVPNQRWGLALIDRDRAVRVVASVGPRDLPAVRPRTWVDDVRASGSVTTPLSEWLTDVCAATGRAKGRLAIGAVDLARMRGDVGRSVADVCQSFGEAQDASEPLKALRQTMSPRELVLIRLSYQILQSALQEVESRRQSGSDIAHAVIAGERVARQMGAQDVRALYSVGGRGQLRPLAAAPPATSSEPWTIYLTVRFCGYWTDAVTTLASKLPEPARAARATLGKALDAARPGLTGRQLFDVIKPDLERFVPHDTLGTKVCRAHGLSLDGEPWIMADSAADLTDKGAFAIVVGAGNGKDCQVVESATVIFDGSSRTVLHPMIPGT